MADLQAVEEKPIEAKKPLTVREVVLAGLLLIAGGDKIADIVTADEQATKIETAYIQEKFAQAEIKTGKDSLLLVKGVQTALPAEAEFKPDYIIAKGRTFKMIVTDTLTDSAYFVGIVSTKDTTGRLHATLRIQPCTVDPVDTSKGL